MVSFVDSIFPIPNVNIKQHSDRYGTPLFIYSKERIKSNVDEINAALGIFQDFTVYYAMKANRHIPVLKYFCALGVGVDCCSPFEVELALKCGFTTDKISVTACFLSLKDLKYFVNKQVYINLDGLSQIKNYLKIGSKRNVGIRIDTATNARDWDMSVYSNSKFGIHYSELNDALNLLHGNGIKVDKLHCHVGWNMSRVKGIDDFEDALQVIVECAKLCPDLISIDVGGGLGVKFIKTQSPSMSPFQWSSLLQKYLIPLNVHVSCELGTKLMANAGILVTECTAIQRKQNINWLGINCGFNLVNFAAFYNVKQDIINIESDRDDQTEIYHIGGNLNEGIDVYHKGYELSTTQEGDMLVILNSGAYCASVSSNHCGRGLFKEILL